MGGAKKPTVANKSAGGGKDSSSKKGKKDKGAEPTQKRAEIVVRVDDAQAMKIVRGTKVITVQELARQLGVKISAANSFLRGAVSKGSVSIVGGHSGHYLYQDAEMAAAMAAKAEESAAAATADGKSEDGAQDAAKAAGGKSEDGAQDAAKAAGGNVSPSA